MSDENKTKDTSVQELKEKLEKLEKENERLRKALSFFDRAESKSYEIFQAVLKSVEKYEYPELFVRVSKAFVALIFIFFFLGVLFTSEPLLFITFISVILTSVVSWCLFISIRHKFNEIEKKLEKK